MMFFNTSAGFKRFIVHFDRTEIGDNNSFSETFQEFYGTNHFFSGVASGPGYPLQVLAALRAFLCYP
jgi:hypothetical protein